MGEPVLKWRIGSLADGFWTCFMGLKAPFVHVRGGPCQHRHYVTARIHCWMLNRSPSIRA